MDFVAARQVCRLYMWFQTEDGSRTGVLMKTGTIEKFYSKILVDIKEKMPKSKKAI